MRASGARSEKDERIKIIAGLGNAVIETFEKISRSIRAD